MAVAFQALKCSYRFSMINPVNLPDPCLYAAVYNPPRIARSVHRLAGIGAAEAEQQQQRRRRREAAPHLTIARRMAWHESTAGRSRRAVSQQHIRGLTTTHAFPHKLSFIIKPSSAKFS